MSPEQRARLDAMTDKDIDFSDIPELPEDAVWYRPGPLLGKNKEIATLPFDADVLAFFRKRSESYSTKMNDVLRQYMLAQKRAKKKSAA